MVKTTLSQPLHSSLGNASLLVCLVETAGGPVQGEERISDAPETETERQRERDRERERQREREREKERERKRERACSCMHTSTLGGERSSSART